MTLADLNHDELPEIDRRRKSRRRGAGAIELVSGSSAEPAAPRRLVEDETELTDGHMSPGRLLQMPESVFWSAEDLAPRRHR